jgi:hypothetical protein
VGFFLEGLTWRIGNKELGWSELVLVPDQHRIPMRWSSGSGSRSRKSILYVELKGRGKSIFEHFNCETIRYLTDYIFECFFFLAILREIVSMMTLNELFTV